MKMLRNAVFFLVLMKFSVDFLFYPKMMTRKEQVRIIYNNYAAESSLQMSVVSIILIFLSYKL